MRYLLLSLRLLMLHLLPSHAVLRSVTAWWCVWRVAAQHPQPLTQETGQLIVFQFVRSHFPLSC